MPVARYFLYVGGVLLALLFAHRLLAAAVSPWWPATPRPRSTRPSCGSVPTRNRRNGWSTTPASRLLFPRPPRPRSPRFRRSRPDASAQTRVRDTFAQFVPEPGRPSKVEADRRAPRLKSPRFRRRKKRKIARAHSYPPAYAQMPSGPAAMRVAHSSSASASSAAPGTAPGNRRRRAWLAVVARPKVEPPKRLTAAASGSCRQNRCSKSAARPLPSRNGNH